MLNFNDDFELEDLIEADVQYGLFEDDNSGEHLHEQKKQKITSILYDNSIFESNPKINKFAKILFIFLMIYFLVCIFIAFFMAIIS